MIADNATFLIHKPLYYTSFDVIRYIRKNYGIKKIGHAGTLDPLARGLLILCSGTCTRAIAGFMGLDKEYIMELTLGARTASYDLETPPMDFLPYEHLSDTRIREVFASFEGRIQQAPPAYAAVKREGKPLYAYARKGIPVDIPLREIVIYELCVEAIALPSVRARVRCGKGTYIRSLAHDIGQVLGCGGYLSGLTRTKIGDFDLKDALDILPERTGMKGRYPSA